MSTPLAADLPSKADRLRRLAIEVETLERERDEARELLRAALKTAQEEHEYANVRIEQLAFERDVACKMKDWAVAALPDEDLQAEEIAHLKAALKRAGEAAVTALCTCQINRPKLCGRCEAIAAIDSVA